MKADVVISDNKVTLTSHPEEDATIVDEFNITAIDATGFTANHKITTTVDGDVVRYMEDLSFTRRSLITARLSSACGSVRS